MTHYTGIINRYRDLLPLDHCSHIVTLNEGDTPLIRLHNIEKLSPFVEFNLKLYAKFEGLNPTGSFKDRGMTCAITQALHENKKAVICASTGNTSAAAAAYANRAGVKSFVIIPQGKIAMGKLAQAIMYGARIIQIQGNFDKGMEMVKTLSEKLNIALVNSVNPYRLQGQKTAAFEIIDALQQAPHYHCIPVGNAGNISAYWMGFCEYHQLGKSEHKPKMLGYQAQGASPLVCGHPISNPETIATAIRIGNPQSWDLSLKAQQESHGWFKAVSDDQILQAQRLLCLKEGVFCEPASATTLAGLSVDCERGNIEKGSVISLTLTGNGLKDSDIATRYQQEHITSVSDDMNSIEQDIKQHL